MARDTISFTWPVVLHHEAVTFSAAMTSIDVTSVIPAHMIGALLKKQNNRIIVEIVEGYLFFRQLAAATIGKHGA